MYIAMWSPPRTISTALMRSWENRPDTFVCDEPFYSYFLKATGDPHPLANQIIAQHDHRWQSVVSWLTGPVPEGYQIFYQKHMAHHLLPEIDREWLDHVTNCFLIREPHEMLTSYVKKHGLPRLENTGYPQMLEIFHHVRSQSGAIPPVIDSRELLENPPKVLRLLCASLGVQFSDDMLAWPSGPRVTDGVWGDHWYKEVLVTTSFGPYRPKPDAVPDELSDVLKRCEDLYQELFDYRLH
ncbi:MAG: hypothetical protein ACR2NM_06145 [Bythopirellula sp.]